MPQSLEETSATGAENPLFALQQANDAMKRVVSTGRSNTWERAVERFKWVMETLSPIAEVRMIPSRSPWTS